MNSDLLSSLIVCNAILSPYAQRQITHAAFCTWYGKESQANIHRARAGYGTIPKEDHQ